jgi:hypothetical protein
MSLQRVDDGVCCLGGSSYSLKARRQTLLRSKTRRFRKVATQRTLLMYIETSETGIPSGPCPMFASLFLQRFHTR